MITSFSRLFRQIFGGSRAQPATEALTRDIVADAEAREAAEHRENLKRAMEAAFATPTATADEPPQTVFELQVLVEEAATAIAAEEAPEIVAEPEEIVAEVETAELEPAIELAEVEEPTEHDIEIVEWDTAKLAVPEAPAVEVQVAEVALQPEAEVEEEVPATAEIEDVEAPEEIVAEQVDEAAPALTPEFVEAAAKPKRAKKAKAPAKKKSTATKKKTAAKKTVALPEDAVWLSDAIAFSLKGEWSTVWTPPEDATGAERLEAFREKAAAGDLVVWGCPEGKDAWEPVKAAYWKTAMVEPLSFLMGRENVATDPASSKAKKPVKYVALKVAQADVEALWPPATPDAVRDAA